MKLKTVAILGAVLAGGFVAYKAKQKATELVTVKLNPASNDNIIYSNTPQPIKNGLNSFWGALDSVGLLPR